MQIHDHLAFHNVAELPPDFRGFQTDLLHPEPFAATRMGLRLAERLKPLLARAAI